MAYLAKYSKSYKSKHEYVSSLKNFLSMDKYIDTINKPGSGYSHTAGHNKYSDWSRAKYKKLMGAKRDKSFTSKKGRRLHCYKGVKHP